MVSTGETVPDFTATLATGEIERFSLSGALENEAPIILAFFPAAFTPVCEHELETFEQRLPAIHDAGGHIYGVSIDSPFTQNEFRDQLSLSYDLISDTGKEVVDAYDVAIDFDDLGLRGVANRAVVVVDETRTATYVWVAEDPTKEPPYDVVLDAVETAAATV